jgi:hypothetical protein
MILVAAMAILALASLPLPPPDTIHRSHAVTASL